MVGYTVTATGQTTDFTIESSMSPDCDQEVFQRLQALPDTWIPAVYRGRPTAARFYLSVRFQILQGEEARCLTAEYKKTGAAISPDSRQLAPYAHELVVTAVKQ